MPPVDNSPIKDNLMDMINILGLTAATITTAAFLPQAIKTINTQSTEGLSLPMYTMFFIGVNLWFIYGYLIQDLPLMIANGITIVSAGIILYIMISKKQSTLPQKIEHLGVAVHDIDEGELLYEKLLGVKPYKRETVESQGVITSFFKQGPNKIELLAPIVAGEGPIGKFLDKKGPGLHHVAYAVSDISKEMTRLKNDGFQLLSESPSLGADNKLICFVHPKSSGGVLIELCQDRS